jgi:hypothetical protein
MNLRDVLFIIGIGLLTTAGAGVDWRLGAATFGGIAFCLALHSTLRSGPQNITRPPESERRWFGLRLDSRRDD